MDAPSLEVFKVRLDEALRNLIQWKMSLLMAGGLDWMVCECPFQPKLFCDPMTAEIPLIRRLERGVGQQECGHDG